MNAFILGSTGSLPVAKRRHHLWTSKNTDDFEEAPASIEGLDKINQVLGIREMVDL